MRTVICRAFDQPETLTVETVADPVAEAGHVVIAVHAAGVNFPDALMVMGQYQVRPPLPFTPGGEAAGVIIEVGSGFSSAAMLDLNEHVLGGAVDFTFIDPDMRRLRPLLREGDAGRVTLVERRVQEVPLETFAALGAGDVLFIDSSHVSKIGSDVNRLYFDVLPALAPGVLIHIHDVAGNLEYPREWFDEGRAWNEQYLLRAFLMHNAAWRIELFTGWLFNTRHAWFRERMPLCARGGGGQLWLRKLAR